MKKIIILAFSILGFGGSLIFGTFSFPSPQPREQEQVVRGASERAEEETLVPAKPVSIQIPSIGLDTAVEHVGEDSQGRMDVPKEVFNTAWYEPGARPGELGNAVIAGHLDTPSGDPSVFYNLHTMKDGDVIVVEDADGNEYTYEVVDVASYPTDEFPIQTVFGKHVSARLNLITCGGVYDHVARDYLERTVVFSELESIEEAP